MNRVAFILLLALCCIGATRRSFFAPKPATAAGGDGPNTWYWSGSGKGDSDYTDNTTTVGWDPHLNGYGASITIAQAGTCTKLSAKVLSNSGSVTFKLGLYNSSNELIADGDAATSSGTPVWIEINVSTNVTATSYYVLCFASDSNGLYAYDTDANGLTDPTDYADAPPASASTSTETGYLFGVKIYVD